MNSGKRGSQWDDNSGDIVVKNFSPKQQQQKNT
jgi:hypothetical protein